MSVVLLVALGAVGQIGYGSGGPFVNYGYPGVPGLGNGYGYRYGLAYGVPRPLYDPVGYYRYYNGAGFYTVRPTPVFPPRVITVRPWLMDWPGVTGRVVGLDEAARTIFVRLPAETVAVRYGPSTRFRAVQDVFPEIRPGVLINIDQETITVLGGGAG